MRLESLEGDDEMRLSGDPKCFAFSLLSLLSTDNGQIVEHNA